MLSISCAIRRLRNISFFLISVITLATLSFSNPAFAGPQWRVYEIARAGANGANSPGLLTWYDSRAAACKGNGEAWIRHCKSLPNSCLGNWTTADVLFDSSCGDDPLCGSYCAQYHNGIENASYSYDGRNTSTASPNNLGGCPTNPDAGAPSIGNPCNPATGNKYQTETDHQGHDNFSLSRHYNSDLALNIRDVGLGVGWTLSLTSTLELASNTTLRYRSPTGKAHLFTNSAGIWQANADVRMTLTQTPSGYTVVYPDGAIDTYDSGGRQVSATDRNGRTTAYTYSELSQLVSVTDPFGHSFTLAYDPSGHVATIADALNQVIHYRYAHANGSATLVRVDYPDGSAKTYHYENPSFPTHLTGISHVDTSAVATRYSTYSYDASGKAILTEHAAGMEHFGLTYDSDTQTTVRDAANTTEVMTFNTNLGLKNLVSRVNQADGKSLNQVFDVRNNLTCKKDPEARVTTYIYNTTKQKTSMTEGMTGSCAAPQTTPATRTTTYQYLSPTLDLPTLIGAPSVYPGQTKTTAIAYANSALPNLPTSITQSGFTPTGAPVTRTVSLQYNSIGQVTRIDGPRTDAADVTTLAYYACTTGGACGQLASITNALGHVTTFDSYDANGRLTQMTDANGLRTSYQYDPRGRVRFMTQIPPTGTARVTEYRYNAAGDVSFAALPDGRTLSYQYSAARKLLRVTDNLGHYVAYGYDLKGNRTQEYTYDPTGTLVRQVDSAFDARNHLASVNAAGSLTQQLHDAIGNLVQTTDPRNNPPTTHQYDALNRLLTTLNSLGGTTRYDYDVNDRLTQAQTANSAITQYQYDDLGNLLREVSADRGATSYSYDTAGNLLTQTDARGVAMLYSYDALNRVTAISYPTATENVSFTYDAGASCTLGIGHLCRVQDESGITEYGYDAFGNILTQAKQELNRSYTTAYTYDAGDRVTSITYPGNRSVTYTRDNAGRIAGVSTAVNGSTQAIVSNRTYRADGLVTNQTYGNGLNEVRQYDLQGRLTSQFLGSADTRVYDYDPNGNVTRKQSLPDVANYTYDVLDQLTGETTLSGSDTFTYDANGNRLSDLNANGNPRNYSYLPNTNRLTQVGNQTVTTDAAGYTLSDRNGNRTFSWDNAGHLRTVTRQGVLRGTYTYNYLHQRTQKVRTATNATTGVTTTARFVYHYDLAGNLIAETRPNGSLVRHYLWVDDEPVAQIQNRPALSTEELVYVHTDPLKTPRLATNTTRTVVWRNESEAFGTGKPDTDPDVDESNTNVRLRFPGQYADGESGLYANWNRYYDPKIGRYITSDPIGLAGGMNTYSYALNNPLRYTDPDGLAVRFICRPLAIPGATQKHCFVYVTCPKEGWSSILSLFATGYYGGVPITGRKSSSSGGSPGRDNPNSPGNSDDILIKPDSPNSCDDCAYEKSVMNRFSNFPSGDVPYWLTGPNSNSFAGGLLGPGVPTPPVTGAPGLGTPWGPGW